MSKKVPKLLVSDKKGNVFDVPFCQGTGMKNGVYFKLDLDCLIKLHPDSELFMLPDRYAVGYDLEKKELSYLKYNPYSKNNEPCYAVAAFVSPGHTVMYNASYFEDNKKNNLLPLFCYSAVVFFKDNFYVPAIKIDREKRQELRFMNNDVIKDNVNNYLKLFPKNRLIKHLKKCAIVYGCPAAKNFFLKRYEGPLPSSPICNSRCIGCISYQKSESCSSTQVRINFVPTAEEIAQIAIFHISNVDDPIVSFGQGCEGEPLMVSDVIEKAIKIIRKTTLKGIINMNTNASKPNSVLRLFDCGLDSIRVSMNSVRDKYYSMYYKPKDYKFSDVVKSIKNAKKKNGFVSINYLVMPGFTDLSEENNALLSFLEETNIDMIQWRNLNYDPMEYFRKMKLVGSNSNNMIGIDKVINSVKEKYPNIMNGYFNPSKYRIKRFLEK